MSESTKPVAVILGGTSPHAAVIDALSARGYFTVLVDYYENPPAKAHADMHVRESTLDKDVVVRVAREVKADLVIATCVDQANAVACYVSEKLGLTRPHSYATAEVIADKTLMKEKLVEHGLPTARHVYVYKGQTQKIPERTAGLTYPLVVKPADNNGSAGVRRVDTPKDLERFLELALQKSRIGRALIEEFISGPELSIDCFIEKGHAKIVLVRRKYAVPSGAGVDQVMQSTGSIAPYPLTDTQLADAEKILSDLARVFKLDNTPMLVQGVLTDQGFSLIEFAARLSGGTGVATTKLISGFDSLEASIDSFLEIPVTVVTHPPKFFSMTNTIYGTPGVFDRIEGAEALIEDGIIDQFLPYKTQGMKVTNDMSTQSRIGAFLVTGPDMQTVHSRLEQAVARLEVYDTDGQKMMRKDLFDRPTYGISL